MSKRNFIGERDLSRKAAAFRLAMCTVKSGNEGTVRRSAHAIKTLAEFAKDEYGLKNIARFEKEHMEHFANHLLDRLDNKEISRGHVSNIISSLNAVFDFYYRDDLKISAREYGLSRGTQFSDKDKSVSENVHNRFLDYLGDRFEKTGDVRYQALKFQVELQRTIGLRFEEAAKFSGKELKRNGTINITHGTKGGHARTLKSTETQQKLIKEVKDFRKEYKISKSMIPDHIKYREWQGFAYNVAKDFRDSVGEKYNFHGERHHYAQVRYKELTGHEPPVKSNGGNPVKKENDYQARLIISEELGHHRASITEFYLGRMS